ncbi:MAG: tripartite tricarboxylate transporter substrate binding protein [Burkholderiaceae bacterium]|nr:tripartite tricarboxylate transporter substrate binding protein [Burkholderiaceae bacterium]
MGAAAAWSLTSPGTAQEVYPSRFVRIVVPFPAGTGSDGLARHIARRLQELSGSPFVVENKPGANGFIGAEYLMKAQPDGYTLAVFSNSVLAANTALFKKLPYDPVGDFEPLLGIARAPNLLLVPSGSPFATAEQLVAAGRERPNALKFAFASASYNIAIHAFTQAAGIEALGVPYQGPTQALVDLAGGQVDFTITDVGVAQPLIAGKRIRPLAVTTTERHPSHPGVPSLSEMAELKGFSYASWAAFYAPARVPSAVSTKLRRWLKAIAAEPETIAFLEKQGVQSWPMDAPQVRKHQQTEIDWWKATAARAGLAPQ